MGRSGQSVEVVDDTAWAAFLNDTVTPRFPDALSVLDAQGQWRDSQGLVQKERSKLLVILAPPGDGHMRLIDEVSDEYKRRFSQESVLREGAANDVVAAIVGIGGPAVIAGSVVGSASLTTSTIFSTSTTFST